MRSRPGVTFNLICILLLKIFTADTRSILYTMHPNHSIHSRITKLPEIQVSTNPWPTDRYTMGPTCWDRLLQRYYSIFFSFCTQKYYICNFFNNYHLGNYICDLKLSYYHFWRKKVIFLGITHPEKKMSKMLLKRKWFRCSSNDYRQTRW